MKEEKHRALSLISADIEKATTEYNDAKEATSMASSHETICLNSLNKFQKELDAAVEAMKKNAPSGS